jgi:hypothetical protein
MLPDPAETTERAVRVVRRREKMLEERMLIDCSQRGSGMGCRKGKCDEPVSLSIENYGPSTYVE